MHCPQCQQENPPQARFCLACGLRLALACAACGTELPAGARFCFQCGQPVSTPATGQSRALAPAAYTPQHLAEKIVASKIALEGERKQVTVLFADLKGSMELLADRDPEEARQILDPVLERMMDAVHRYEGTVNQVLGDGIMALFGAPIAHEDPALRACYAALAMQAAMHQHTEAMRRTHGLELRIRVGLNSGEVVVRTIGNDLHMDYSAVGQTTHLAARMEQLATPGSIRLSAATWRLVEGWVQVNALGPMPVKGLAEPVEVCELVGANTVRGRVQAAVARGLTPLVGRDADLALLYEHWQQSLAGQGQVVWLWGEAGIGKSRLVEALHAQCVATGVARLTLRCTPYHTHSALAPVIEHVQRVVDWQSDPSPSGRLTRLEQALTAGHLPLLEMVPLLAALLSLPLPERYAPLQLSPQRQKQRTLDAIMAWLLADAERQPVLAVWEDLHWADPSTLELLGLLLAQVPTARMLLVLTSRPEFQPPWASRVHPTQLTLRRLGQEQMGQMITSLTQGKALPPEVLAQVLARTDGVPLFVEELVKMLLESELLCATPEGYALTGPLPPRAIPVTLQGSLLARLDRLGVGKEVAQLGATVGREFSYDLLRAVAPLDAVTLQRGLAQLVDAALVYQRGQPPQVQYLFKHALIQDAAYQSLLKSTRQQYHQRIAEVLQAQFPETVESQPELLAQHYTEANLGSQAVAYWQRAGQRAVERSAYVEAISHLTQGLGVLQTLPNTPERTQQELLLQTTLGPVLMMTRGFAAPEVEYAYARARELCRQVGETPQLFSVLRGLWQFYNGRGEYRTARELGEQCLHLAQHVQDSALLLEAHHTLWTTLFLLGELPQARQHLEQGMAYYDPQQHRPLAFLYGHDPGVCCQGVAAVTLWLLGYPDQALTQSHAACTLSEQLAHPASLVFTRMLVAIAHQLRQEAEAAHGQAEALIALATEQGFALFVMIGSILQHGVLAVPGQREQQISRIGRALSAYRATGTALWQPYFLALLAEVYRQNGQIEAGLATLADALTAAQTTGERWGEAELHRLRGEHVLRQTVPDEAQAEACFHQALTVARSQQARSLELRAAMSLARLWRQQGKYAAARQVLAQVYDWFTEGFVTPDLRQARALLDELT